MAWTPPKTWHNEPLVASDMNTYLRDNMAILKTPASTYNQFDLTSKYVTNSTSFVDIDSNRLRLTVNTQGGDIFVGFHGVVYLHVNGTMKVYFDVTADNVRLSYNAGLTMVMNTSSTTTPVSFVHLVHGLPAGSHTFAMQWRVSEATAFLYESPSLATNNITSQFWVREIS